MNCSLTSDISFIQKPKSHKHILVEDFFDFIDDHKYLLPILLSSINTLPDPCKNEAEYESTKARSYNIVVDEMYVFHKINTRNKEKVEEFHETFKNILRKISDFFESIMKGSYPGAPEPEITRSDIRGGFLEKLVKLSPQSTIALLDMCSKDTTTCEIIEEPMFHMHKKSHRTPSNVLENDTIELLVPHKDPLSPSVPDFFLFQWEFSTYKNEASLLECKSKISDVFKGRGARQYGYFQKLVNSFNIETDFKINLTYLTYQSEYKALLGLIGECPARCTCEKCEFSKIIKVLTPEQYLI